ncbi:MAG: hypothetical protein AAGG50_18885, partial [Bacteroidota bacterium]
MRSRLSTLWVALVLVASLSAGCAEEIVGPQTRGASPSLSVVSPGGTGEVIGDVLVVNTYASDTDAVRVLVEGGGLPSTPLRLVEDSLHVALLDLDAVFGQADTATLTFTAEDEAGNTTTATRTLRRQPASLLAERSVGTQQFSGLARSADGAVWYFEQAGLTRYKAGSFSLQSTEPFLATGLVATDTVWVTRPRVTHPTTSQLFYYDNGTFVRDDRVGDSPSNGIFPLSAVAPDQAIWFGWFSFLQRWDRQATEQPVEFEALQRGQQFRNLAFEPNGFAWAALPDEIYREVARDEWESVPLSRFGLGEEGAAASGPQIMGVGDRIDGELWAVAPNYLLRLDGPSQPLHALDDRCALDFAEDYVPAFADAEEGLWFTARSYVLRRWPDETISGFSGAFGALNSCS